MSDFFMDYGLFIAAGFFVAFILLLAYGLCRSAGDERRSALSCPPVGRPALVLLHGRDGRDERELLTLFNDWPIRAATYPDGSRDQLCEDLDVFADAAAPGAEPPEAA